MIEILLIVYCISTIVVTNQFCNIFSLRYLSIAGFYLLFFFISCLTVVSPYATDFIHRVGYYDFLLGIFLHITFYCFGLMSFIILFKPRFKMIFNNFCKMPMRICPYERKIVNWVFIISILIMIHQLLTLKSIPIFMLLSSNIQFDELAVARSEMFDGGLMSYVWHLNRQMIMTLLTLYFFVYYLDRKGRDNFLRFLGMMLLAIFNNAMSSALAPVATLFLLLFIALMYKLPTLLKPVMVVSFISILLFPILVEYWASDNLSFGESVQYTTGKIFNRYSVETFERTLCYFDVFGHEQTFLGGRTNKLFTFFNGESLFPVQNYMFVKYLPKEKLYYASNGNMNANFISYMYSDFGQWGIIIASWFVGMVIAFFQCFYLSINKTPLVFAAYLVTMGLFWKLTGTQPTTILFSHGTSFLLIGIWILWRKQKKLFLKIN